jgi:hypothetical protein
MARFTSRPEPVTAVFVNSELRKSLRLREAIQALSFYLNAATYWELAQDKDTNLFKCLSITDAA